MARNQAGGHAISGDDATGGDPTGAPRPFHRPGRYADLTAHLDGLHEDHAADHRAEIAASTAAVVIAQGRARESGAEPEDFVALADRVGLDTLTSLWRDAGPGTLPGALWVLYVVRQWCRSDTPGVVRLWRAGEPLAPAEVVVAGVGADAGEDEVVAFADAALRGVYDGEVDVALERVASFLRVVAMGRRWFADASGADPVDVVAGPALGRDGVGLDDAADRNDHAAADLALAADRWRAGTLR
ncbi:hypothetical protein ACXR2U_14150 [Jatrophihabitans sp. YIM 134969]